MEERNYLLQVMRMTGEHLLGAVYEYDVVSEKTVDQVKNQTAIILTHALDAKIYHKDWPFMFNFTENIDNLALPYCKQNVNGIPFIVDYHDKEVRKANAKFAQGKLTTIMLFFA